MPETCSIRYQIAIRQGVNFSPLDRRCGREAVKDGYCIFHLDDPDKPLEPILEEIRRQSSAQECKDIDLAGFVFPKVEFKYPAAVRKPFYAPQCKFYGDVSFRGIHFPSYTTFFGSEFLGTADFSDDNNPYDRQKQVHFQDRVIFTSAIFHKEVRFRACHFHAMPEFIATKFKDVAIFAWATLAFDSPNEWLNFHQCEFHGLANLEFRFAGEIAGMRLSAANLQGLKISSLPRDQVRIEFSNIQKWYEDKKWWRPWPRKMIRDEIQHKSDPIKVIDCYRYLEKYFYDHSDFDLANHFYVGQLVLRRRVSDYGRVSRFLSRCYQLVSNFGASVWRPVLWLCIVWALFPLWLLSLGINVHREVNGQEVIKHVNYDITLSGYPSHFWSDYWSTVGSNLSLSTIDRKHELSPASDSLQKVVLIFETATNVVLLSFLVIAVRRKFTPKKPLGE
ncbi:MAG: hypothetical protein AB1483_04610 [Candidatus Zixiibacteriota bacterium]